MLLQQGSRCLGSIRCMPPLLLPRVAQPACSSSSSSSRQWRRSSCTTTSRATADTAGSRDLEAGSKAAAADADADCDSPAASSSGEDLPLPEFPEMQLVLPVPTHSQIKTAEFVKSSVDVAGCPPPKFPEFAVIGRSNVGKSSLINLLTNRKSLAMVSKQPGKTRCINHFIINDSWYLVDLPGYGYARTGKDMRRSFDEFTRQYFKQRTTLAMVLLLVDCSIPPQDVDLEYAAWLGRQGLPFSIVFTKADKRKKGQPRYQQNVAAFKQALLEQQGFTLVPPSLVTSASSGLGKQQLLNFVASLRVMFEQQQKQTKRRTKQQPAAAAADGDS